MSGITWKGDHLFQHVRSRNAEEKLGFVQYDTNSETYVLWLYDTRLVFNETETAIRGDEFPTMEEAKQKAASSVSASIFHHMWLSGLRMSKDPEYIREQREIEFIRGSIYGLANASANTIFELALRLPIEEREEFFQTVGPQGYQRDPNLSLFNKGIRYGGSELTTQLRFRIGDIPDDVLHKEVHRVLGNSEDPIQDDKELETLLELDGSLGPGQLERYLKEQIEHWMIEAEEEEGSHGSVFTNIRFGRLLRKKV